jgi:hypothetical protein
MLLGSSPIQWASTNEQALHSESPSFDLSYIVTDTVVRSERARLVARLVVRDNCKDGMVLSVCAMVTVGKQAETAKTSEKGNPLQRVAPMVL